MNELGCTHSLSSIAKFPPVFTANRLTNVFLLHCKWLHLSDCQWPFSVLVPCCCLCPTLIALGYKLPAQCTAQCTKLNTAPSIQRLQHCDTNTDTVFTLLTILSVFCTTTRSRTQNEQRRKSNLVARQNRARSELCHFQKTADGT